MTDAAEAPAAPNGFRESRAGAITSAVFSLVLLILLAGLCLRRAELFGEAVQPTFIPKVENLGLQVAQTPPTGDVGTTASEAAATAVAAAKPISASPTTGAKPGEKPQPAGAKPTEAVAATGPAKPADTGQTVATPATGSPAGEKVDWSKLEITGPVPRANLVVYLTQRIVMLRAHADVVRVYRDVGVPPDLSAPKSAAADRRAPVGTYYLCGREENPERALYVSYPSPADAARAQAAGLLAPRQIQQIGEAWKQRARPPQDTPLGGGIRITGDRDRREHTTGGFSLYPEQLEELWLAVSDGTPVMIVK